MALKPRAHVLQSPSVTPQHFLKKTCFVHNRLKFEILRVHVPIVHQYVKEVLPRVFEGLGTSPLWRAVPGIANAAVGRASPPSALARQVSVGEQHSVRARAGVLDITDGTHTLY